MSTQLSRLSTPMALLVAVIVLALIADGIYAINHIRMTSQATQSEHEKKEGADNSKKDKAKKQHACTHGFYVSQAAHAHKGGDYVKQIAQSDLGKSGDCPSNQSKQSSSESDDTDD